MSTGFAVDEEAGTGATPVFVDDSGRRGARVRFARRALLVALALYGILIAIGLTGSLSLPVVHLGDIGQLPARVRQSALGPNSQRTPLPAALAPARTPNGGPTEGLVSPRIPGRAPFGTHVFPVVSAATTTTTGSTVPAAKHGKSQKFVTTVPPGTTVPSPVTATTTPHSPTTGPHPPTTQQGHGPPTSVPGKGKGP